MSNKNLRPVIFQYHAMDDEARAVKYVGRGLSVRELIAMSGIDGARCVVDGKLVSQEDEASTVPSDTAIVVVGFLPGFEGVTIAAVSAFLKTWGGVIMAGISLATSLYAYITAPKKPDQARQGSDTGATFSGQSNEIVPYGASTVILGRAKTFPRHAAVPSLEALAGRQRFTALFDIGAGDLDVADLKVGSADISTIRDAEYRVHKGTGAEISQKLAFYVDEAFTTHSEQKLVPDVWTEIVPTRDCDTFALNFVLPSGVYTTHKKDGMRGWYCHITVQASNDGGATWRGVRALGARAHFNVPEARAGGSVDPWNNPPGTATIWNWNQCGNGNENAGSNEGGVIDIGGRCDRTLAVTFVLDLPRGDWRFRATRRGVENTPGGDLLQLQNIVHFTDVVARRQNTDPLHFTERRTILECRLVANDQLQGNIDTVNCVATNAATLTPADAYLWVLRGPANARPVPDRRIDLPTFERWRQFCVSEGLTLGTRLTEHTTVAQLLEQLAAVGRATPAMMNSKYSVIVDEAGNPPVQLFSNRTAAFSTTLSFPRPIHGLRARYVDPAEDWQEREVIAYAPGYDKWKAVDFDTIDLFGIVDRDHAHRITQYHLAQQLLRREFVTIAADVEHLVCTRGDRVLVATDTLQVGGMATTIEDFDGTQLKLRDALPAPVGEFGFRYRRPETGGFSRLCRGTYNPVAGTITPTDWDGLGSEPSTAFGAEVVIGTAGQEVGSFIVTKVTHEEDFRASIEVVNDDPGVYEAWSKPIPPYVPNVNPGWSDTVLLPPSLTLETRELDPTYHRLPKVELALSWGRQAGFAVIGELLANDVTSAFAFSSEEARVLLGEVDTFGWTAPKEFKVRARTVCLRNGAMSGWVNTSRAVSPVALGEPLVPQNPRAEHKVTHTEVTWDAAPDPRLQGYVVTANGAEIVTRDTRASVRPLPAGANVLTVRSRCDDGDSAVASCTITVRRPLAPAIYVSPSGNRAIISWGNATLDGTPEYRVQTTYQVELFEVEVVEPTGVTNRLGRHKSEIVTFTASTDGDHTVRARAVDIGGNTGEWSEYTITLSAPDGFELVDRGDIVDMAPTCAEKWKSFISPVDGTVDLRGPYPSRSLRAHFKTLGFDTPRQKKAAGFNRYCEPLPDESIVFKRTLFAAPLTGPTMLSVRDISDTEQGGSVTQRTGFLHAGVWKELDAPLYVLPAGAEGFSAAVVVRTGKKALTVLKSVIYDLSMTAISETGSAAVPSTGQVHVVFRKSFSDVRSVQVTSKGSPKLVGYVVDTNQRGITIYLNDPSTGQPCGGDVSWTANGVL